MNRNNHNSISNKNFSPEVSRRDAVTSTESRSIPDGEPISTTTSTYASIFWLFNYIKMCTIRLVNDLVTSFMIYWYPGRELLPAHIVNLMQVQRSLRAERESHTVTYNSSREQHGPLSSRLSMRTFFNAIKSYILCSEDVSGIQFTSNKDFDYFGSDREPMFVIVDSSCVSNPSSKELLIDNKFNTRDTVLKKHYNKNVMPGDMPSTSKDLRNDLLPPQLMEESDSIDEMQMMDINLQSDNELLVGDSDGDNDSIVISYLRNKNVFLDMEELSETSLDAIIPSYPASPRSYTREVSVASLYSNEDANSKYKRAIEFLHHDDDFLIAAEMGDENILRMLIHNGTNIHEIDHLGRNALHLAVCSGNRKAVNLLLKAGVKSNIKDNLGLTPLSLCLMRRPSWETATMLFDYGAALLPRIVAMDTGLFLQFVMMCTPTKEEEKILGLLVEKGALVNDPEAPGGRQALHFAAMSNNTHLIKILIELGANLFVVNHRNETPKEVAATFKCKEAYTLLEDLEELYVNVDETLEESAENTSSN